VTTFSVQHKVEVQFVPGGSFIDISTRSRGFEIVHPRGTVETPVEATTATVLLDNTPATAAELTAWGAPAGSVGYAPFTPDNLAGAFSGQVERDRMVRLSYSWNGGANSSVRFFGWSDKWVPDMSVDVADATCTLTASCVMSRHARRDLISDYGEQITALTDSDYWPYDDDPDATYLRGLSLDRTDIPAAQVIPSSAGTGSQSLGQADAGILVDGIASFARGDGNTASPVILHKTRGGSNAVNRVSLWVKLDADIVGSADDIVAAYDKFGNVIWRFLAVIVSGKVVWKLIDSNGVSRTEFGTNYPRDDSWHWISLVLYDDAGTPASQLAIRDKSIPDRFVAGYFPGWPRAPYAGIEYIVVGGNMNPRAVGKQGNTINGSVSGLWVRYNSLAGGVSYSHYSAAGVDFTGFNRAADLVTYGATADTLVGGGVGVSVQDLTPVQLTGANENLLDAWREHVRTIQGRMFTRPDGRRHVVLPLNMNPIAVSLTLDAEADLDIPTGGWSGERTERPTRQTVTSPVGSVTLIDQDTETATQLRLSGSDLASSAGDPAVARGLAYRQMVSGESRLTSFGFDVTLMPTDQRAAVFALLPYQRIRIQNLPVANLGVSYKDVYASGWVEEYVVEDQAVLFVFDTDPADAPPEGVFDDATYGRFAIGDSAATVTGGTCVATTATGTLIVTSTSPLSTAAGDYPCDLDWNGERVTVTAPGGAVSPQTFPVTARGVAPTVARVHAAGEPVEVQYAMRFGA